MIPPTVLALVLLSGSVVAGSRVPFPFLAATCSSAFGPACEPINGLRRPFPEPFSMSATAEVAKEAPVLSADMLVNAKNMIAALSIVSRAVGEGVGAHGDTEKLARLQAELGELGFEVVVPEDSDGKPAGTFFLRQKGAPQPSEESEQALLKLARAFAEVSVQPDAPEITADSDSEGVEHEKEISKVREAMRAVKRRIESGEDGNAEDDSAANGVSRKIAAMRAELDALAREVEQQEKEKVRKKETSGASKAPVGGGAKQQSGKPEGKPTKPEGKTTEKEPAKKNEAHRSSSPDGKPADAQGKKPGKEPRFEAKRPTGAQRKSPKP